MDRKNLKATLVFLLIAAVVLFALQNARLVEVNFLFWSFAMSRIFLILIVFALGFLAGYLFAEHAKRKKHK